MSAFATLLRKEATEMLRDKRLPVFALVYCALTGLATYFFLSEIQATQAKSAAAVIPPALSIAAPLGFFDMLALLILAATFVLDAVGRERDEGMLGLLLTSRATPGALLASKAALGLLAYLFLALLGLAGAAIMAAALGPVVLQAVLLILAGPLLVLFVFLLGTGLLVSVLASSARIALAIGLAIDVSLFLLGATPLFSAIVRAAPALDRALQWTPFSVAVEGQNALVSGGGAPWAHYAGVLAVGVASLAAAWLVFRRKEVPQG